MSVWPNPTSPGSTLAAGLGSIGEAAEAGLIGHGGFSYDVGAVSGSIQWAGLSGV